MKQIELLLNGIEPFIKKASELNRLQRIAICVATVVVVIAAFGFLLLKPKFESLGKLHKEIAEVEEKLKKAKRSANEFAKCKQQFEEAKAKFAVVSRALPNTEEIPSLLTSISQAGNTSGLTFLLFQPLSGNKKDFYSEIPIRMELSGSYHDLGTFFDKLARLSRIVNVSKCATSSKAESLKISCTANTYKFIEQSENKAKKEKKSKSKKKK